MFSAPLVQFPRRFAPLFSARSPRHLITAPTQFSVFDRVVLCVLSSHIVGTGTRCHEYLCVWLALCAAFAVEATLGRQWRATVIAFGIVARL